MKIDVYDLDHSLSNDIIGPAINQLFKAYEDAGWPKYPSILSSIDEWKHILTEIKWTFNNYSCPPDATDYNFEIFWNNISKDEYGNTRVDIDISNKEEHARYTKDVEDHEKRVQDGLNLFSKYYRHLWL